MEIKQIENIVEALLFAAGDEVSAERLARVIDIDVPTLKNIIRNMMSNYNYESRGLKIIELENRVFHSWPEEDREKYLELTKRYLNDFREGVRQFEYAPGEGAPKKESL